MLRKGWNFVRLAAAAGLSVATVTRWFNEKHQTPSATQSLAEALGQPVERYFRRRTRHTADRGDDYAGASR